MCVKHHCHLPSSQSQLPPYLTSVLKFLTGKHQSKSSATRFSPPPLRRISTVSNDVMSPLE